MENNHHHHHHYHHDLPPFPSSSSAAAAAGILQSPHLVPILPQPSYGLLSSISTPPPQHSYYYSNPLHPLHPPPPPPPPSSFISYGFAVGGNNNNETTTTKTKTKDEEGGGGGRRVLDAWSTKVARSKRRLARQRSLTIPRTPSSPNSSSTNFDEHSSNSKGQTTTHYPNIDPQPNTKILNLYTFFTPEKKVLKLLLKKELKNSDVGSLGRIVLPKREAEDNLPLLADKDGMKVVIRDVNSNKKWAMKYKYWANNRSRMYVLENTGDFVKQNGLLTGDTISLYEDDRKKLYVSIERGENYLNSIMEENNEKMRKQQQPSSSSSAATAGEGGGNCYATNNSNIDNEEEEAALALLIEELKHKSTDQDQQSNSNSNFIFLSQNNNVSDWSSSNSYNNLNHYNNGNKKKESGGGFDEDLQNNGLFDQDCFGGLDTLPEVSGFKFPLFDYLNNDRTT